MGKNSGKNGGQNLSSKYSSKPLVHAKQLVTDALKIASRRIIQEQQKQLVIWIVIKSLIKLQKSLLELLENQLKVKQTCQKKVIYLQKKKTKSYW